MFQQPAVVEPDEPVQRVTISRTGDPRCRFVVAEGEGEGGGRDADWLVESIVCRRIDARGGSTFETAFRPALTVIFNHPGYRDEDGRPRIASDDLAVSRGFVEQLIRDNGGRLAPLKGGRPGCSVKAKKKHRRRLALIVIALGALLAELKAMGVFTGPNAILLEDWDDLPEAEKARQLREEARSRPWQKRFARDVGRFYRFGFEVWIPVRTSDVRCYERVVAFARKVIRLAAIELYVVLIGKTGCRPGEPQWFTFLDWFSKRFGWFSHGVKLRNKGDEGESEKDGILDTIALALAHAYVDGERKRVDPKKRGMAEFRALAEQTRSRDPKVAAAARAELGSAHVMLNGAGRRLTYKLVWHHLSRFLGERNDEATMHWLRHEYVFTEMREIEALTDKAEQELRRRDLCAYMGWKTGELMLECYDAYERDRRKTVHTLEHQERRAAEERARANPANDNRPVRATSNAALNSMLDMAA